MTLSAASMRKLATLGLTSEQMSGVLDVMADVAEGVTQFVTRDADRKSPTTSHAARQKRYRDRLRKSSLSVTERHGDVTNVTPPSPPPAPFPDKEIPPTPPKEINSTPLPPPQPFSLSAGEPFDDFWELFPNKVGKADARKKFPVALRKVSFDTLMEALRRYAEKTDDRPWCNPATWLHQERWGDQPAQVARGSPKGPKGLEWFDAAIDWIDEDERRRAEGSVGRDQDDAGGQGQRLIGHRS